MNIDIGSCWVQYKKDFSQTPEEVLKSARLYVHEIDDVPNTDFCTVERYINRYSAYCIDCVYTALDAVRLGQHN
jgi:hypothetical protein